jgi:hypothetical protein
VDDVRVVVSRLHDHVARDATIGHGEVSIEQKMMSRLGYSASNP